MTFGYGINFSKNSGLDNITKVALNIYLTVYGERPGINYEQQSGHVKEYI
jgi:hypothetical protein